MITVLKRSLEILDCLGESPETAQGLGEIASRVRMNASTCARLMQTLVACGYAEQVGKRKGYMLGPRAYALAARGPYRKDLVRAAEPLLAKLAAQLSESALLAVLRNGRRIVLAEFDGGQMVQVRESITQNYDPFASATGRLLLAYSSAEDLAALLRERGLPDKDTWPEASTEARLRRELESFRVAGCCIRSHAGGVTGLAFPVVERGQTAAALGVHLPTFRYAGEHQEAILRGMKLTAESLSAQLSGRRTAE